MGQMGTGIVEWMHLDLHECERTAAMPSRDLEGYPLAALVARIGVTRSTQACFLAADRQCTELPLLRLPRARLVHARVSRE